jgi:hypothetical protein
MDKRCDNFTTYPFISTRSHNSPAREGRLHPCLGELPNGVGLVRVNLLVLHKLVVPLLGDGGLQKRREFR